MDKEFAPIYGELLNELLIMHHLMSLPQPSSAYSSKERVDKLCAYITAHNIIENSIN